jgi:hypothetical protein
MTKKGLTSMAIKPKKKSKGIVSWPKTERPREKLLHSGPETLSDGELMAVLLRIGKAGQLAEGFQATGWLDLSNPTENQAAFLESLDLSTWPHSISLRFTELLWTG